MPTEPLPSPVDDAEAEAAPTGIPGAGDQGKGWKALLKGLVMIASLAAIGFAARALGLADTLDTAWLDHEVVGKGLHGEAVFVALGALAAAVGVPRQVVAFGGGYAFGLWGGVGISLIAQTLGCALAFFYARLFGRGLIRARFARQVDRVDGVLRGAPFTMTLLIRFLPVGSNLITNLAAGVTSVRARTFILGSAVGYIPQTIVFALLGTGIRLDPAVNITLSVALFVVSGVLGAWLYRRMRRTGRLSG